MGAVAQKVDKDYINSLKKEKEILKEETKLNALKLKAAYETIDLQKMMDDAEKLNKKADDAMRTAKKHSAEMTNGEVGDEKLSKKASRSAKDASKYANDVHKQTEKIAKSKKYIEQLEEDIRKQGLRIEDMKKNNA